MTNDPRIDQEMGKLLPIEKWRTEAINAVPPEYADRNLHGKYLRLDNDAAGKDACADDLEDVIPALVEMVEREREQAHAEAIEAAAQAECRWCARHIPFRPKSVVHMDPAGWEPCRSQAILCLTPTLARIEEELMVAEAVLLEHEITCGNGSYCTRSKILNNNIATLRRERDADEARRPK